MYVVAPEFEKAKGGGVVRKIDEKSFKKGEGLGEKSQKRGRELYYIKILYNIRYNQKLRYTNTNTLFIP